MKALLYIALGGALGSVLRYLLTKAVQGHWPGAFPWGTMTVNLLGCLMIGVLYGLFEKHDVLSPEMRLLLTVGICGGFTTFSTFMNESLSLMRGGELLLCAAYIAASVILGLGAVCAGQALAR
ncbi:MAG: fluoride efflux transporter CrcB [Bacteroidales bacterium]|nr:fluoride efflux transporter CrcB [Bacteroidales bacterium]MCD8395344.1 fluoride efflux transporter CrcB [Bacteroidales bacterium]